MDECCAKACPRAARRPTAVAAAAVAVAVAAILLAVLLLPPQSPPPSHGSSDDPPHADPELAELLGAAAWLTQQQRWGEARAALLQAAQRQSGADPARQRTLLQLGAVCARSGRHADAADAYRRALAAGGDEPSASWNLALSLKQLGRLEEAVQHFADATEQQAPAGEPPTA